MSSSDTVEGNGKIASKMKDTIYSTVSAYACVWGWGGCSQEMGIEGEQDEERGQRSAPLRQMQTEK